MGEVFRARKPSRRAASLVTKLQRWYTAVYRGVYVPKGREVSLRDRACAAWLASGRRGVVAGVASGHGMGGLHGCGRIRMLEEMGWIIIRVIAEERPAEWLARVQSALLSRGCPIEIDVVQGVIRTLAA